MQKSLAVKSQELHAKNEAANAKLKQMVKDQQEAEKKKVQSQEIQQQLAEQTVHIEQKRTEVMADLDQVEPAVIDAQTGKSQGLLSELKDNEWVWLLTSFPSAVKSIKKQHLVEVRSMANPPATVKMALESVCLLLHENASEWRSIRSVIMRENFITTIVNFSGVNLT